jgi:hypothetical protein
MVVICHDIRKLYNFRFKLISKVSEGLRRKVRLEKKTFALHYESLEASKVFNLNKSLKIHAQKNSRTFQGLIVVDCERNTDIEKKVCQKDISLR